MRGSVSVLFVLCVGTWGGGELQEQLMLMMMWRRGAMGGGKEDAKGDKAAREQRQVILELVLDAWLCLHLPRFLCFDRMYLRFF